jgi:hypothetical protein
MNSSFPGWSITPETSYICGWGFGIPSRRVWVQTEPEHWGWSFTQRKHGGEPYDGFQGIGGVGIAAPAGLGLDDPEFGSNPGGAGGGVSFDDAMRRLMTS